jgi:hypothetical protein
MDELPHRAVIDLQPALSKLGDQSAQGEIPIPDPLQQPHTVLARDCLWLVTPHLAGLNAAGLSQPPRPANGRADANSELLGGLIARQAALNRRNNPLPKIEGVRFAHPCRPPSQPAW